LKYLLNPEASPQPSAPLRPAPDEVIAEGLRVRLRWGSRHDAMAAQIMREFNLQLPRDRELIRQLTFVRVRQGVPLQAVDVERPSS
jgi:hypothetical protein